MIASIEATSSGAASCATAETLQQQTARNTKARHRIERITNLSNRGQSTWHLSHENESASPQNLEIHDNRPVIRSDGFVHQPLIQYRELALRPEQHEVDLPDRLK